MHHLISNVYEIVSLRDYTWGDATKHLGQLMYAFHGLAAYILHRLLFAGKFSNHSRIATLAGFGAVSTSKAKI